MKRIQTTTQLLLGCGTCSNTQDIINAICSIEAGSQIETVAPGEVELRFSDVGYTGAIFARDNLDSLDYVLGRALPAGTMFSIFLEIAEYMLDIGVNGVVDYEYIIDMISMALNAEVIYDVNTMVMGDGSYTYSIDIINMRSRNARYRIISRVKNVLDAMYSASIRTKSVVWEPYDVSAMIMKPESVSYDVDELLLKTIQIMTDVNMWLMKIRSTQIAILLSSLSRLSSGVYIDMKVPT